MTKKDYIVIAKVINDARKALSYASVNIGETNRCIETITDLFVITLYADNSRFNGDKFREACGLEHH